MAYRDIDAKRADGRKQARKWYLKNREKKLAYEAARRALKKKAEKKEHAILRTLGAGRAVQGSGKAPGSDTTALLEKQRNVSGESGPVAHREPRTKA